MIPQILNFGFIKIYSFGMCLALGFIFFVFLFWRSCRDKGIEDEEIFDNILFVSMVSFIGARLGYVFAHGNLFYQNILRIFLLWKIPGLSIWGALVSGFLAFIFYTKKQKISTILFLDSYGKAIPAAMIAIFLGVFLDGSSLGKLTRLPWGMPAVSEVGKRHPVALYGLFLSLILIILLVFLEKKFSIRLARGTIGYVSLSFIGLTLFILAFFQENLLYWEGISIDGMVALMLFLAPLLGLMLIYFDPDYIQKIKNKIQIKI